MKNFRQEGETLRLKAPYDVVSGNGFLVGAIFAVALHSADAGNDVNGKTEGVFDLNKHAGAVMAQGDRAFWDDTAREITTISEGNKLVGVVTEDSGADMTVVAVKIIDDSASALPVSVLTASAALDYAVIAAGAQADKTIAVPGAALGDAVSLGLASVPAAGLVFNAFVSAADTVTVRASNISAAPVDPASASFRVDVIKM